jgi:outer membrane lipoprotein-sorting protein
MQLNLPRGPLWIAVGLLVVIAGIITFVLANNRGTPQERLVAEIQRELARVETVQGRVNITLQDVTLEQELWVQRPGFMRTETEAGPSAFAGTIVVLNNKEGWVYSPALDMATVVDRSSFQEELADEAGAGSILERMPDRILAALQTETQINQGNRSQVAGRAATLLEFVIPPNDPSLPAGILQVWLDDQYSYPLAWRDSSGRELRFSSVTFNAEIDPLTFVFFPPPGASVRRIQPGQ